jgi:ParB family chromosome partitioning protein
MTPHIPSNLEIRQIPLEEISPSSVQPRYLFDLEELQDLALSIQSVGLIQPILLKERATQAEEEGSVRYEIIAGERRWRAAQIAKLQTIPAILLPKEQEQLEEIALIENLQRVDLNPLEIAKALKQIATEYNLTQEQLALRIGKKRSTIANYLRLLQLPSSLQEKVNQGALSFAHAKAVLSLESVEQMHLLSQRIIQEKLSSRESERIAAKIKQLTHAKPKEQSGANLAPECDKEPKGPKANSQGQPFADSSTLLLIREMTEQLQEILGCRVQILPQSQASGKIEITYHSLDDFERILASIGLEPDQRC